MFNDAAGGLQGYFPHMKSRLEMLSSYINKMNVDISRRSGMALKDFVEAEHEELWMDAEDAVKRKFADKIVSVQFESSLLESPLKDKLFAPMTSSKLGLELKDHVR
jgi:ATP-dependent protease ClpP protease subunit